MQNLLYGLYPVAPFLSHVALISRIANYKQGTTTAKISAFLGRASVYIASATKASCKRITFSMFFLGKLLIFFIFQQAIAVFPDQESKDLAERIMFLRELHGRTLRLEEVDRLDALRRLHSRYPLHLQEELRLEIGIRPSKFFPA